MKINYSSIFIILFILVNDSFADYYTPPLMEAQWEVSISKTLCRMRQDIPLYGSADFVQRSGQDLQFSIQEQRQKPQIIKANLSAIASPWVHEAPNPDNYLVYLEQAIEIKDYGRLAVYGQTAETMIDVLLQGQYPTFTYIRASSDLEVEETRVAVSAIKFIETYEEFLYCRNQLLPFGSADFQDKFFVFRNASDRLSSAVKKDISNLVSYLQEMTETKLVLGSATSIAGSSDKRWFNKRAKVLLEALVANGINEEQIEVQADFSGSDDNSIRLQIFGPDALRWIHYRKGNTRLTHLEKQRLDLLARYKLEHFQQGQLIINSYTDSKGPKAKNKAVAKKRGEVIKQYLLTRGLPASTVLVKAHGESRPIASNRTRKGRAKNRRVVIDLRG